MKATRARAMELVVLLAVLWLAGGLRADQAEEKAVQRIREHGGRITRDDKADGKPVIGVDLTLTGNAD